MRSYLIDSNVLLDVATSDPSWVSWSRSQLQLANDDGLLLVNPIIMAELAPAFDRSEALDEWLNASVYLRRPLPFSAAWIAGQAHLKYRRAGGVRLTPIADFYIGAHAQIEDHTLITRDVTRYRTYFPDVPLICPAGS